MLAVTGAVLVAAGVIVSAIGGRAAGATLIRTVAFVAAAGIAGLLFDYRIVRLALGAVVLQQPGERPAGAKTPTPRPSRPA